MMCFLTLTLRQHYLLLLSDDWHVFTLCGVFHRGLLALDVDGLRWRLLSKMLQERRPSARADSGGRGRCRGKGHERGTAQQVVWKREGVHRSRKVGELFGRCWGAHWHDRRRKGNCFRWTVAVFILCFTTVQSCGIWPQPLIVQFNQTTTKVVSHLFQETTPAEVLRAFQVGHLFAVCSHRLNKQLWMLPYVIRGHLCSSSSHLSAEENRKLTINKNTSDGHDTEASESQCVQLLWVLNDQQR